MCKVFMLGTQYVSVIIMFFSFFFFIILNILFQRILEKAAEYSLEGLMLKLQWFGHLMGRAAFLEKTLILGKTEGKRRGWQRTRWLDSITDSVNMNE